MAGGIRPPHYRGRRSHAGCGWRWLHQSATNGRATPIRPIRIRTRPIRFEAEIAVLRAGSVSRLFSRPQSMTPTRSTASTSVCRPSFSISAKWSPGRNTSSRATPRNTRPINMARRIDVSELTLEQVDTHDQVMLVKEKRATSPESVANFLYTWAGRNRPSRSRKIRNFH